MSKKNVLFIDDRAESRDTYSEDLNDIFGEGIEVVPLAPIKTIEKMIALIINYPDLISLVFDQRLYESGDVVYSGIELAAAVRASYPKLPIYILTNYTDRVDDEYHVEYVFEKEKIFDEVYKNKATARVRRHLNIFSDIIDEREDRFTQLLPKYLGKQLSDIEVAEFLKLKAGRIKPYAHEFDEDNELRAKLDQQTAILDEILKELEENC